MSETSKFQLYISESGSFQNFSNFFAAKVAVLKITGAEINPFKNIAAGNIVAEIFSKKLLRDCEAFFQNNKKKIGSYLLNITEQVIYRAIFKNNNYMPPIY